MKKFTFMMSLFLAMSVGTTWAKEYVTTTVVPSTNVESPEHVYYMRNGNLRWMTQTSGATETLANAAQFAFYAVDGSEDSYQIYCVSSGKWLSYTKADAYENKRNFVELIEEQNSAQPWKFGTQNGKDANPGSYTVGNTYWFRPCNNAGEPDKYMNWYQGKNANPNDDPSYTVGVWQQDAATDAGSAWIICSVESLREDFSAWETDNVGTDFGKYTLKDAGALAAAKKKLEEATDFVSVFAAIEECEAAYIRNGYPTVGKYYRIKNTKHGTYTGVDGLNMKNKAEDANDPTFIWQFVEENGKSYLKNVYSGLYPQYVQGGGSNTTAIGTSKDYAFTYALHAAPEGTTEAQWNIFFGGRQVNIEANGNVNQWFEDGAHHYLYEVEVPENMDELCVNWYKAHPKADTDVPAKIDIDENASVIISPSEYGDPRVINKLIDNATENLNLSVDQATAEKIRAMYDAWASFAPVQAFINASNAHGAPLSVAYTVPNAEYGTIILPVNWTLPEGWSRYACAEAPDGILTLENKDGEQTNKNNPYIVQFNEEQRGKTYQFIGYANGASTTNVTRGLLTGVLEDGSTVPAGAYILSDKKGTAKLGFYQVAEGVTYNAAKYRCYLAADANNSRYEALFFEGNNTTDGINDINVSGKRNGGIYSMAGQRLNKLQKGLNIVNGKVVLCK